MKKNKRSRDIVEVKRAAEWIETEEEPRKQVFVEIYIVRKKGKYALAVNREFDPLPENDLFEPQGVNNKPENRIGPMIDAKTWNHEMLTGFVYDVLYNLPHICNKSYFVGYINGRCRLIRLSEVSIGDYDLTRICCHNVTDAENDSILWKSYGDDSLLLCDGDMRRVYCTRTRSFSEWYMERWL